MTLLFSLSVVSHPMTWAYAGFIYYKCMHSVSLQELDVGNCRPRGVLIKPVLQDGNVVEMWINHISILACFVLRPVELVHWDYTKENAQNSILVKSETLCKRGELILLSVLGFYTCLQSIPVNYRKPEKTFVHKSI